MLKCSVRQSKVGGLSSTPFTFSTHAHSPNTFTLVIMLEGIYHLQWGDIGRFFLSVATHEIFTHILRDCLNRESIASRDLFIDVYICFSNPVKAQEFPAGGCYPHWEPQNF